MVAKNVIGRNKASSGGTGGKRLMENHARAVAIE
jgi:hypothetical protein